MNWPGTKFRYHMKTVSSLEVVISSWWKFDSGGCASFSRRDDVCWTMSISSAFRWTALKVLSFQAPLIFEGWIHVCMALSKSPGHQDERHHNWWTSISSTSLSVIAFLHHLDLLIHSALSDKQKCGQTHCHCWRWSCHKFMAFRIPHHSYSIRHQGMTINSIPRLS